MRENYLGAHLLLPPDSGIVLVYAQFEEAPITIRNEKDTNTGGRQERAKNAPDKGTPETGH